MRGLLPLGAQLLFFGSCGSAGSLLGLDLYGLDAPEGSPRLIHPFGNDEMQRLVAWGRDRAAFLVGSALWTTDGHTAQHVAPGALAANEIVAHGDLLLVSGRFEGEAGLFALAGDGGLTRLHSGSVEIPPHVAGGLAFFTSRTQTHGSEPWVTDGTTAGTRMLADINPGVASSEAGFSMFDFDTVAPGFIAAGGRLFFPANDGKHGVELWAVPLGAPARIVRAPAHLQVQAGAPATFSVEASGDAPLAFQWLRNGVPIAGATAATYTLAPTAQADSGAEFAVVVSNAFGNVTSAPALLTVVPVAHGLLGTYFGDANLGLARLERLDPQVDFNWRHGAPAAGLPADGFSVRWTGEVEALATGSYTFHLRSDDGARLWLDGQLSIDDWGPHAARMRHVTVSLESGRRYRLRLEHRDLAGTAGVRLLWTPPGGRREVVPAAQLFPGS